MSTNANHKGRKKEPRPATGTATPGPTSISITGTQSKARTTKASEPWGKTPAKRVLKGVSRNP